MASYPNSVKSFASRSAGQTIASAHVNDLQDEVNAVETALVTGPINLQASTLASLSVTGGSTVAALTAGASTLASLSVSGGSTVGALTAGNSTLSNLSVSGGSTTAGAASVGGLFTAAGFRLSGSTTVTATDSTTVLLPSSVGVVLCSPGAASTIHGFSSGVTGQTILLMNQSAFAITLKNQSVSANAAGARIQSTGDVVIGVSNATFLSYDAAGSGQWRVIKF